MTESSHQGISLMVRAFWLMFAKTLAFIFSLALPLLLVRRLDQTQFGLYKQVFLVVGSAVAILPLGFSMSAFYFLPRERERQGQIVFNILLFNLTIGGAACLALALRPTILEAILNSSQLIVYAPLIGLIILLWIIASFLEIVAVAHQETRLATAFIIASQLTRTVSLLSAAIVWGTVRSLIYAAIVHGLVQTAILLVYLNSRFKGFWRAFDLSALRMQLGYALPLGLAGLLFTLQIDLHNYFVSSQFGAAAFAIYAVGGFDLPLVGILGESIGSVMIPRVSYLQKHNDHREIIMLTAGVMRKLAVIYFPLYAFLMIAGREFITFLFTDKYVASWPLFAVNITLLPLNIILTDPIMRAYAAHRFFLLKTRAILLILFITFWIVARQHLSLLGVIIVVIGMNVIERAITAFKAARIVSVERRDFLLLKDVGKVALASGLASLVAALVHGFIRPDAKPLVVLVVCGAFFGIVYLMAILSLGILTDAERDTVRRQLARLQRFWPWRRAVDPAV